MVKQEITALLKKEIKVKAPVRLKKDILREIKKKNESKRTINFSSIESFKGAGILLILLIISSTFVIIMNFDFKHSFSNVFDGMNNTNLELLVLSFSVLFFLSVLDQLLFFKNYTF